MKKSEKTPQGLYNVGCIGGMRMAKVGFQPPAVAMMHRATLIPSSCDRRRLTMGAML
jgi:hypothetical protein